MLDFSNARIARFAATWVGNKSRYEGTTIPKQNLTAVDDSVEEFLMKAMLLPFAKTEEFFYFHHDEGLDNHRLFDKVYSLFNNPDAFQVEVRLLADQLYNASEHPRVQGGEFFVAIFDDVLLNGEAISAIGFWKIQNRDYQLKTERTAETFALSIANGIPINGKPELAALILNIDEAEGYRVCAVDTVSKKDERSFWIDEFMRLRPICDHYFQTRQHINVALDFVKTKAPFKFGLTRPETIEMANRAAIYFKDNDRFEIEDFAAEVMGADERTRHFLKFREDYAKSYAVPLADQFEISAQAVKKEAAAFKNVIKLDKNFMLTVNSARADLIERGFDEKKGKNFYRVYFDEEA